MNRETIWDELRRLEGEVVEAEQALAEQEALLVKLKREGKEFGRLASALSLMREQQQSRQQDRYGFLPFCGNERRTRKTEMKGIRK